MQSTENETYRVVIPSSGNSKVLMLREGDRLALPCVTIPKWQRVAQCVTESVADLWNLKALCLFQPDLQSKSHGANHDNYVVMESRDPHWQPDPNFIWVPRCTLYGNPQSSLNAEVLQEILEKIDSYNTGSLPGPFARCGWFDDLTSWTQDHLRSQNLRLTGAFRQFNGHPFFSLIRLETNGPAIWFKAVGEPNLHEYGITILLAEQCSQYFPKVIAARSDWHAWLMEESRGLTLEQAERPEPWVTTASSLAQMQRNLCGRTDWLLAAGCRDFRMSTVLSEVDLFLEVMADLMPRQQFTPPPILSRLQLNELRKSLKCACHRIEELGIPDTLGHRDLNPGNVIVRDSGSVFLDLAETYVGFPFPTFEYLRLTFTNYLPQFNSSSDRLTESYLEGWKTLPSLEHTLEALALARLLAPLFAALRIDGWKDSQKVIDGRIAKRLRMLTRRMYREASEIKQLGVTCAAS